MLIEMGRIPDSFAVFVFLVWAVGMLQATNRLRVHIWQRDNLDGQSLRKPQHRLPSLEQHPNVALLRLQRMPGGCIAKREVQLAESRCCQYHCTRIYYLPLLLRMLRNEKQSEKAGWVQVQIWPNQGLIGEMEKTMWIFTSKRKIVVLICNITRWDSRQLLIKFPVDELNALPGKPSFDFFIFRKRVVGQVLVVPAVMTNLTGYLWVKGRM